MSWELSQTSVPKREVKSNLRFHKYFISNAVEKLVFVHTNVFIE